MDIVEHLDDWQATYQATWLAHYEETGEIDWSRYPKPRNKTAPSGKGIDLSKSRLIFISSAGGYLKDSQDPFDAANDLGDYSIRAIPVDTPFEQIAFAHEHYDHTAIDADPQAALPLGYLAEWVKAGKIGDLTPSMISFMGYQPDVMRVVNELIPAVVKVAKAEQADAALLVPV